MEADFVNVLIPSFDDVSFGVPRLIAGGFVEVVPSEAGALLLRPSPAASALLHDSRRTREFVDDVAVALDTRPYPEIETEDRRLGRLVELDRAEFDREVQGRQSWQQKLSPRGHALFDSIRAEQIAASGEPVSSWKPRKKRSRTAGDRGDR